MTLAASLAFVGFAQPAFADEVRDSLESPALVSTNATPVVVDGATVPLEPRPGFRVLPYLQKPASDQMTINWFSELGNDATLVVTGPGLPAEGASYTVAGVQNPVNGYQRAELEIGAFDNGRGLRVEQGAWVRADSPYKHSQLVEGLQPGSSYRYEVIVDGYRHEAGFTTPAAAGGPLTEPFYVIAFSDTETDPKGRVTQREWEVTTTLADGSEPRPGEDSAWVQKFGGGMRNGQFALNYMLTEDQGQYWNNQVIAERSPDLLLLAGDIVERGSSQTHWDEWFDYFAGDKGVLLDDTPIVTSLGNHEVYGYGTPDDRSLIVRSRAEYNQYFDTFGSDDPSTLGAYHRIDQGPVTFISLDVTNGQPDASVSTVPDSERSVGDDSTLTPEQYGTDTQGVFTYDEYARDWHHAFDEGWAHPDADPAKPDQPDFMPGSPQYEWFERQLQDARDQGQIIIVQWHHVAYSNGVHGTTMGNDNPDNQPGTPTRHLQPLLEQYGVAAVISGHDEMFEVSYVDEDGDGLGVYHWDVGVASDGLRADMKTKTDDGSYEQVLFNTHSIWMAQTDQPEMWVTNENGVTHLVEGGKHYGHLDMHFAPYTGAPLASGVTPAAMLTMVPVAVFPILDDDYEVTHVERREMTEGTQIVYFDAQGNVLDPDAEPAETDEPGTGEPGTDEPGTDEPTPIGDETPGTPGAETPGAQPDRTDADADGALAVTGDAGLPLLAALALAALAAGGWMLRLRRVRA